MYYVSMRARPDQNLDLSGPAAVLGLCPPNHFSHEPPHLHGREPRAAATPPAKRRPPPPSPPPQQSPRGLSQRGPQSAAEEASQPRRETEVGLG